MENNIEKAAQILLRSEYSIAFTGAGISAESGIPPFRGEGGIWNMYNPEVLDIDYFMTHPAESWKVIRQLFYDYFAHALPNEAHLLLARMEKAGKMKAIITQNIDHLHQKAGSETVYAFHGDTSHLVCTSCMARYKFTEALLQQLPPFCEACGFFLKPDFVFFGEPIPAEAYNKSFQAASKARVVLVIGTTGEVMPAGMIPYTARQNGATIIEINTHRSAFTDEVSHIYLQGKAGEIMHQLGQTLKL